MFLSSTTDDEGNNDSTASENSENQVPVQSTTKTTTQNTNTAVDTTKKVASAYVYKNGTYTATGSYMSPGGYDQLGVTITVKNDVVTDTSVQLMAGDHTSSRYQQMFADNYKQYVVGQNLSGLNVGKVSRSSLTPEGFNDALNQIRSQAKA